MRIDVAQLEFIEPMLREILVTIEAVTGIEFTITSLYRINDNGVHGQLPLRGTDLRMRDEKIGKEVENLVNEKYKYDPQRQNLRCAILHGEGANLHLHLQVHPNTDRI